MSRLEKRIDMNVLSRKTLETQFGFLGCGFNYHKRCASKIPNNCSGSRQRVPSAIPLSQKGSVNSAVSASNLHSSSSTATAPFHYQQHQVPKPSPSISQLNTTTPDIFVTSEEDANSFSSV